MTTQTTGQVPEWTLGERLRKARGLTGLDQRTFAAELGVDRNTVSSAETDSHRPIRLTLRAWALRTGVDPVWLETGYAARESNPQPAVMEHPRRHLRAVAA